MNISAKELAKLINVSPATVSMVFNNKPGISDATRELVLKTAARVWLCAKKNEASGASSRIIQLVNYKKHGKVAADTPFFSQLTEGISTECTRQGCALHISYFYETMDIDSQLDALRAVDCEGHSSSCNRNGSVRFPQVPRFFCSDRCRGLLLR